MPTPTTPRTVARRRGRTGAAHAAPARPARASYLPDCAGAYVLAIALPATLRMTISRRADRGAAVLPAGRYLYCGSARGPGGLRARIARHLRRRKTLRWHVDRLTTRGRVIAVWAIPDGDECALVASLAGLPVPLPGFGSSDCRGCASHLLAWPDGVDLPLGPPTLRLG